MLRSLIVPSLGILAMLSTAEARPIVFVTLAPLSQLVAAVGGESVETRVLVPTGQSPHGYEPTPRQMAELARARLYLTMGTAFETRMLDKVRQLRPDLPIVDVAAALPRRTMRSQDGDEGHGAHEHGSSCPCQGGTADPHVWLDPRGAAAMVEPVREGLVKLFPEEEAEFARRGEAFKERCQRLEARLTVLLKPLEGRSVYVYHPAFGYFTDRFAMRQIPVELEGKSPSPRHLAGLIRRARDEKVRVVFVQAQFSDRAAQTLARAIGGRVVPLDPLAADWLENLERMGRQIARAYGLVETSSP